MEKPGGTYVPRSVLMQDVACGMAVIPSSGSTQRDGRMHHIMVSRKHKRTPVILVIDDLDIRVVNKTTGKLLRRLTLYTTIGYQPLFKKSKGPNP